MSKIRNRHKVILLHDISKSDEKVHEILMKFFDRIKVVRSKLDGDFARFKNMLIPIGSCKYLFQIDADELIPESLIKKLPVYLALKSKCECPHVPRINIV